MNKRDVQEGCANGLYRVCTHSSNTGDENMDVLHLALIIKILLKDLSQIITLFLGINGTLLSYNDSRSFN